MTATATQQAMRLIELVAWLSQRDTTAPVSYHKAAARLGVTPETVRKDLNVLVALGDDFKPWLASLSVAFVADGFTVRSRGPFRRPFRFTPDEVLALAVGLATARRRGRELAHKFLTTLPRERRPAAVADRVTLGADPSPHVEQVLALARRARDEGRTLEVLYCGSDGEPARRRVHPHQVVQYKNRWYVYAWAEDAGAFRRFRAERFLEAAILGEPFTRRPDFQPLERTDQLLQADAPVAARVRFAARIARWLAERYPGGRAHPDGSYEVTFRVADPAWFAREILQYGAAAEVVEPASLREAVGRMVE